MNKNIIRNFLYFLLILLVMTLLNFISFKLNFSSDFSYVDSLFTGIGTFIAFYYYRKKSKK